MEKIAEHEDTKLSIDGARLTPALRARAWVLSLRREQSVLDSLRSCVLNLTREQKIIHV